MKGTKKKASIISTHPVLNNYDFLTGTIINIRERYINYPEDHEEWSVLM